MWIDTHAHLSAFEESQIQMAIEHALASQVEGIVNICTDQITLEKGLKIHKKYPWIYNTCAITPHDVETFEQGFLEKMKTHAHQLVAIGECGLDYYYKELPVQAQKELLCDHFELALKNQLPLVIHCREAFNDLFELLDAHYLSKSGAKGGILHCFTGTFEEAKQAIDRGFYISYSGIVTFKNSTLLQTIAQKIPLEHCVIETDAPYLAPVPKRGKTNEPANVCFVGAFISELRGISQQECAQITTQNAKRVFSLEGG
jgi:TatD DNase family protein